MTQTNITSLRQVALQTIQDLKSGALHPRTAQEINNSLGKACQTVKLQLEYAKLRKEKPDIAFMNT